MCFLSNLLILLAIAPAYLSSPGLFNFSSSNAFIEIDTQSLSCSRDTQSYFSLSFDVYIDSNSSVLFTGISGSLLPSNWAEDLAPDGKNFIGVQGDPLALFIYIERPYIRLMVMRLTDFQVRFYLHHAFGYFDRRWKDWHKVEIAVSKRGKSHVEITFKVDQKINNGVFAKGDILWPDWSILKNLTVREMGSERRFYFNEAFLGLPSVGTMSRYAIDSLVKYRETIRSSVYANTEDAEKQDEYFYGKFGSFRGAIKSFLVASECACGTQNPFMPKIFQIGSGIKISSVCDISSLPPLAPSLPGNCNSKVQGISCGCLSYSKKPICYCPSEKHCAMSRTRGSESMLVGLPSREITDKNWSNATQLAVEVEPKSLLRFLVEDTVAYNHSDSCFANIYLCEKPITYQFWMYIDPIALINGSTMIMKHASHRSSPWHMQITFNGYPLGVSDPEHIMKLLVEIHAPPHYKWNINGCENDQRVTPGQWHQVRVYWDKKTLSLYVDGSLCGTTGASTSLTNGNIRQRFGTRRTPFLFLGDHFVENFIFNGDGDSPQFLHLTKLSDGLGGFDAAFLNISGDFYVTFQLNGSGDYPFLRLPGLDITEFKAEGKLTLEFTEKNKCRVLQLPESCKGANPCILEVERHGSSVTVYSRSKELPTAHDLSLCDIARSLRQRRRTNHLSGLAPSTPIRLLNRGRAELEQRRLIHTSKFPTLRCGFNYNHSASPLEVYGACEPSTIFLRSDDKSVDSYPKTPVKGALTVSHYRLLLQPKTTSMESLCLQDLELCQYGLTISFWIISLPATRISKSWPILQQVGLSGSQLTVDLFRDDGQYVLDTSVKSLHTISGGKAISKLWTVTSKFEKAEDSWTLVTISWSHIAGLSVKFNGTLVGSNSQSQETISLWEFPTQNGFWLGHRGNPDSSDSVIVDDFEFIPAELNYLALVDQEIGFKSSSQGLEPCRQDTCRDGSSCYPLAREISFLGDLCRCELPRRLCRELPMGIAVNKVFTGFPTISTTATPAMKTTAPKSLKTAATPLSTSKSPRLTTSPSMASTSSMTWKSSRSSQDSSGLVGVVLSDSHLISQCDPPCQHGGKCIESNGEFSCDCSSVPFWGHTCTREHVGWLAQIDGVFGIEPHRNVFATYNSIQRDSKQRFIFRTTVSEGAATASKKRVRKSATMTLPPEYMVLLSIKTELGTLGLVTMNGDFFLVVDHVRKSKIRLLPCLQDHFFSTDDTLPHVVQLEHRSALLRIKIDGVMVYPKNAMPNLCDKWLFFSPVTHINNRTHVETTTYENGESSPQNNMAVLGAWFNGEGEFKGAIGGWMVDGEEMIMPTSHELVDTPNMVYELNRHFGLSNGDFYWIRLYSLTPVTVLYDSSTAKRPTNVTTTFWFWIVGYIALGLLLLLFLYCAFLRIRRQTWGSGKRGWRRADFPVHSIINKSGTPVSRISSAESVQPLNTKLKASPTQINGNCLTTAPHRLKAHTFSYEKGSVVAMDNLWRARMLTLQPPMRPESTVGSAALTTTPAQSLCSFDEIDDVEEILVTPEGKSVITLATNHGVSVKQWSTSDGSCNREILSRQKNCSPSGCQGLLALHKSDGVLFTDDRNEAQLYPLNSPMPSASIRLPSTVWGVFPFDELFLFVSAPMADTEKDFFAYLHFWSPCNKSLPIQSRLKIKPQWFSDGCLPQSSKRLPPLLGPDLANLLLRWVSAGSKEPSFSIAVDLSWVSKQLSDTRKPLLVLDSHLPTSLVKHSIDLQMTVFLAADIAVTGDTSGVLHIWHIHSGEIYRSVQSDPIPIDGPLLVNPAEYDFSQLKPDSDSGPITALAAAEPAPTETGIFTWFCSGDDSGCVAVRRCVISTNKPLKNVASRIHAKFRPYSRTTLAYSADTVTCARMLIRSQWRTNKPEAFLATGDSSGCIRVWLLPQCTQLAQLSASCESGLQDLALSQSTPLLNKPGQWLQVVGLVRRDRSSGSSSEHGRVVIIHLSASEENGVPNAMHSPRIRIVQKH